jgi:acetyltransferase
MNHTNLADFASGFQHVIGVPISMRPLRPDDFEIEMTFIRGLSAETRYKRLLGGARAITPDYVTRLTRVDYPREFALAAVVLLEGCETLLGVARYATDHSGNGCEFAIVIADDWQGRGLGKLLLERLIEVACAHRISYLNGFVLSTHAAMLRLARKLGFELRSEPGDARLTRIELRLDACAVAA